MKWNKMHTEKDRSIQNKLIEQQINNKDHNNNNKKTSSHFRDRNIITYNYYNIKYLRRF